MLANNISQASAIVKSGGVIAYSTETVLGLGCDPFNESAVKRVLWLKAREPGHGLILLVADLYNLKTFSQPLSSKQYDSIEVELDKTPTTWLVPANKSVPCWITGNQDTVAVRIAGHPIAKKLCEHCGAIVSTSANYSDYTTVRNNNEINKWFGPYIDYVIIGAPGNQVPSKIRDVVSGKLIR